MRPSFNESLVCCLEPRMAGTFATEQRGFYFSARELTATGRHQNIEGTVGALQTGLTLYSTNCPFSIKPGDRVKVGGNSYTVDRVELHKDRLGLINSSRFDEDYLERKSPKTIYLV